MVRAVAPVGLVQQGKIAYDRGNFPIALTSWQQAEIAYRRDRDPVGVAGSQVNQAQALMAMGRYRRACKLLTGTVRVGENSCEAAVPARFGIRQTNLPRSLQALALNTFGDVLRLLGNFDAASATLAIAGEIAQPLRAEDRSAILVNIGNILRDLGDRDLHRTDLLQLPSTSTTCPTRFATNLTAAAYYRRSMACYRQADSLSADLNQLGLQVKISHWLDRSAATEVAKNWRQQFNQSALINQIQARLVDRPDNFEGLNQRINFARNLVLADPDRLQAATESIYSIVDRAQLLEQKSVLANAQGTLGWLYEQNRQWTEAKKFTQQALALATTSDNDTRYQWEWQMGRILQHQTRSDFSSAQAAYDRAIVAVEQTRRNLQIVDPDAQFSLRDSIEPLYRELIDLSLRQPHPDFVRIIDRVDALKLAELENFLQCQLDVYRSVNEFAEDSVRSNLAVERS
jgi:tetratricopeptide (TPR) repeat protein